MARLSVVICFLLLGLKGYCQPDNSTCEGVIELGVFPICNNTIYSNVGATPFDIEFDNNPGCFIDNPPTNDVWFGFITASERKEIVVTIQGSGNNSIKNIQAALYRGVCAVNSIVLRKCAVSEEGEQSLSFDLIDLTPNAQYYLRIDNYGGDDNEGDFTICIDEKSNDFNLSNETTELCSGRLFDSGGPTGNYSDREDYTFTICPSEFHQCVELDMVYFNIEHQQNGLGDKIIFYNGPNTSSPVISALGVDQSFGTAHGGGGSCYKVQADDCLTIQFRSDATINFEGFEAKWQCTVEPCTSNKQIKISGGITAEDIEEAISTPLSRVKVDTIICDNGAYGTFNGGDETDLGLHRGLLLTTGSPFSAIGPNNSEKVSTQHSLPGDNDLDILSQLNGDGSTSNDACVVEMEVEVFSNELTFEYIFGSDEYPEFVGESFNDIFALLISGPGIEGIPEIGNQKNLATLPNGEFVQINSVNHLSNWEYYRNNAYGQSIEYDGLTSGAGVKKSLTATTEVLPCNTYRLKLAIADRGDFAFDSGVFIAEISSGVPTVALSVDRESQYLVEKCTGTQDEITISLNRPLSTSVSYRTTIEGTATKDVDYQLNLPEEITFEAGETTQTFSIIPFNDDLDEGVETIIIKLLNDTECGTVNLSEITIDLNDEVDVQIEADQDTLQTCLETKINLSATGASEYTWSPVNNISDPFSQNTILELEEDGWLYVQGTIGNNDLAACKATDSIYVQVINPTTAIQDFDRENFCKGETLDLQVNSNFENFDVEWSTESGDIVDTENGFALELKKPGDDQTIYVKQTTGTCITYDSLNINVDDFFFPLFNFTDTTICQSSPTEIVPYVIPSNTSYTWTPATYLDNPNIADPIVIPEEDQIYTLTAISEKGYCQVDSSISVKVFQNEIEILSQDTLRLCAGDQLNVNTEIKGELIDPMITWTVDRKPSSNTGQTFDNSINTEGYLTAIITDNGCFNADSIYIELDELPDLSIRTVPDRSTFCAGEIVTLLSEDFPNTFYPDITFEWLDIEGPSDRLNIALETDETRYYIRKTTNGLCEATDSILITVDGIDAQLNFMDTIICKDDDLNVEIFSDSGIDEAIWPQGVCETTTCNRVIFSPKVSDEFEVVVKAGGCRDTLSFFVGVVDYELNIIGLEEKVPLGTELELRIELDIDYDGRYYWLVNEELLDEESSMLTLEITDTITTISAAVDLPNCAETVLLIEASIPDIVFPNAFVPSGHELNSTFTYVAVIDDVGFESALIDVETFEIFNRWGERVFDCANQDCLDRGWDGRRNGQEAPAEVYAYIFKGTLPNGDEIIRKGNVTLIR